jgi:hypothetical protein
MCNSVHERGKVGHELSTWNFLTASPWLRYCALFCVVVLCAMCCLIPPSATSNHSLPHPQPPTLQPPQWTLLAVRRQADPSPPLHMSLARAWTNFFQSSTSCMCETVRYRQSTRTASCLRAIVARRHCEHYHRLWLVGLVVVAHADHRYLCVVMRVSVLHAFLQPRCFQHNRSWFFGFGYCAATGVWLWLWRVRFGCSCGE